MSLLAWNKVCSRKSFGGLGMTSFKHKNSALLCKWIHKWQTDRSKGWSVWLRDKYGCSKSTDLTELPMKFKGSKASNFLWDVLHSKQKSQLGNKCRQLAFNGKSIMVIQCYFGKMSSFKKMI